MMENAVHQIWFMPWADLRREIKIGNVSFWPFSDHVDEYIQDQEIKDHLNKYFQCYVDYYGKSVNTIAMCTYKEKEYDQLSEKEYDNLQHAYNALVFSRIAPAAKNIINNESAGAPSSDRYQLICQNFCPGCSDINVRAGDTIIGGLSIDKTTFTKPFCLGRSFSSNDDEIINGLNCLVELYITNRLGEHIFRSMEWFRLAHTEAENVSILSKVVMMNTAFEVLLQVPNISSKKEHIAKLLDKLCTTPYMHWSDRQKKNVIRHIDLAWWAYDFYDLRNKIVHGNQISIELLKYKIEPITHLLVADIVYWECVVRMLFQYKCIGDSILECAKEYNKLTPELSVEEYAKELLPEFLGIDKVHAALGWVDQIST